MSRIAKEPPRKSASTQTGELDTELVIARLQEQVKLLTIENEVLRKHTVEKPSGVSKLATPVRHSNRIRASPGNVDLEKRQTMGSQKSAVKPALRGCSCKGNCATKICGCVKRESKCGETCRCTSVNCQNQEPKDAETNKENLDIVNTEAPRPNIEKVVNKQLENINRTRGLFSPDVDGYDGDLTMEQGRPSTVYFGSPKKLDFMSDEEFEVKGKEMKKGKGKNGKKVENDTQKKRGRPKKVTPESNNVEYTRKVRSSSTEDQRGPSELTVEKHSLRKCSSSEIETQSSEDNQTAQATFNYQQNIRTGMLPLRRNLQRSAETLTADAQQNTVKGTGTNTQRNRRRIQEESDSDEIDDNASETPAVEIQVTAPESDSNSKRSPLNATQTHSPGEINTSESKQYNIFEDENFDPTKPTHQLRRTPTHSSAETTSYKLSDLPLPPPLNFYTKEEEQEEVPVPAEFNQPEVDWNKYQSQLVPCGKCKRKFHPSRVKKHEVCCKKL